MIYSDVQYRRDHNLQPLDLQTNALSTELYTPQICKYKADSPYNLSNPIVQNLNVSLSKTIWYSRKHSYHFCIYLHINPPQSPHGNQMRLSLSSRDVSRREHAFGDIKLIPKRKVQHDVIHLPHSSYADIEQLGIF